MGVPLVVALWLGSVLVSGYHVLAHEAPLLPSILGQWSLLAASLAYGLVGYHVLGRLETAQERNQAGIYGAALYVLAGAASLLYSVHQYLSPEVGMPIEGVGFEALFVALIGGIAGLFIGRAVVDRDRALTNLQQERDRFSMLFRNIPDPIAEYEITDREVIIRRTNEPFTEQFGVEPPVTITELNERIAGLEREAATELDERMRAGEQIDTEVQRRAEAGRRWYKLRTSPYQDGGFAIYTDITEQQLQGQQLAVLSRVLRHNLRNRLTVVDGFAEQIATTTDDEPVEEWAGRIQSATTELLETSEHIKTVRDRLEEDPPKPEPTEIVSIVQEQVDVARSTHPDVSFTFDGPDELRAEAHPTLSVVVDALVEVLVAHNDREQPEAAVSIEWAEDNSHVVVRIEDNSSGLPEQELVAIESEEPSPLEHASDVSLWMASWFVEEFGGVLTAESEDGTRFEITLEAV